MGKSELIVAQTDWEKRVAKYIAAGIPQAVWAPIAKQDMTKVYQDGGTGMSNAEADTAVFSASTGQAAITHSPRHSGGILGDIETVASNILPDAGNIITSLPRGLFDLGKEALTPSTWESTGKDLTTGLSEAASGNVGEGLRTLTSSPLLSLIPGLSDLSDLTTAAGRETLLEHPITAALDVLPFTKPLSAAAGASLLAEGGSEALTSALADTSMMDRLHGVDVTAIDPSARAALVAGQPVKAALRAGDRTLLAPLLDRLGRDGLVTKPTVTVDPVTGLPVWGDQTLGPGQRVIRKAAAKAHLDAKNRAVSSFITRSQKGAEQLAKGRIYPQIEEVFKELTSKEALEAYSRKAQVGDVAGMSTTERAVYDKEMALRMELEDEYQKSGKLVKHPEGLYTPDHPVSRAHRARDKAAAKLPKKEQQLTEAVNRRTSADDELKAAKIEFNREANLENTTRLRGAVRERQAALRNHAKSRTARTAAVRDVREADKRLQRKIIRNPPTHLHPLIRQDFRNRISSAYTAKQLVEHDIPPERASELYQIDEYRHVMDEIQNNPIQDRFYAYLGKDATKELFTDAVNEALKLSRDGLAPLYSHTLRSSDVEDMMKLHVARVKDTPEAQIRRKAWNLESSVFNSRASLTREMLNIIERDTMQEVYDNYLTHVVKKRSEIESPYRNAAKARPEPYTDEDHRTTELLEKEWAPFDFDLYGIKRPGGVPKSDQIYLPRDLAENLSSFAGNSKGVSGIASNMSHTRGYSTIMRVFRTSVLYGPRHFAHVVMGGMAPVLLDSPDALTMFPTAWDALRQISGGKPLTAVAADLAEKYNANPEGVANILKTASLPFDYKTDAAYKMMQTKIGGKYAQLTKDMWAKTGAKLGEQMAKMEDTAQSMYQLAVALKDIEKGRSPYEALEHMRKLVVNLDSLTPFERTVMKQIFPFYSFTRFATKFLVQLPFDHPLRVSILTSLSTQAQEEWGTGLPQDMMSLFFVGSPNAAGNLWSVNLRNLNPFRSISSMFTLSGFIENLNPLFQAPFIAAGYNPLSGSSEMYPEIEYDSTTGSLTAARPKGDWMSMLQTIVPEAGALNYFFNISDNLRQLQSQDPGAFSREMEDIFNIPFAVSQYNLPNVRGNLAKASYEGAQNALTSFKKGGGYADTIGRYNLIPYQGHLIPSQEFATYWDQIKAAYAQSNPGASPEALLPKPPSGITTNTLQQLIDFYSNNPQSNPAWPTYGGSA